MITACARAFRGAGRIRFGILATFALMVPFGVTTENLVHTHAQIKETIRMLKRYRDQKLALFGQALYANVPSPVSDGAAIEGNEWMELNGDLLSDTFDCAKTMLGRWQIKRSLVPVCNRTVIDARQNTVKMLCSDPEKLEAFQELFTRIGKAEDALYVYWQGSQLLMESEGLYFTDPSKFLGKIPVVGKPLGKVVMPFDKISQFLNNHRLTLEGAWFFDAVKGLGTATATLGFSNIMRRLTMHEYGKSGEQSFNFAKEFKQGITQPFRSLNFFTKSKDLRDAYGRPVYNQDGNYDPCLTPEQREDVSNLNDFSRSYLVPTGQIVVNDDGQVNMLTRDLSRSERESRAAQIVGSASGRFYTGMWDGTGRDRFTMLARGYEDNRDSNSILMGLVHPCTGAVPLDKDPSLFRYAFAGTTSLGMAAFSLWTLVASYGQVYRTAKLLYGTMNALRMHMNTVASGIRNMVLAAHKAKASGLFTDPEFLARVDEALAALNKPEVKELLKLLGSSTFRETSILYSRGKVLHANRLFNKIKDSFLPLMRVAGEIDAYCAMASLYAKHEQQEARYCFVEFVQSDTPMIELCAYWTPVLESDLVFLSQKGVVTNDLKIGGGAPANILFTGPNGGGKSTVLKAIGHAVMLAQSWGMAPAQHARMTLLDGMRSCLDPRENITRGISKFMASKGGMAHIDTFLHNESLKHKLALVDEPYSGTVDDEMARRTSDFCSRVANVGSTIAVIATHVKPVFKESNQFGFHHVGITHGADGKGFECTFKTEPGLCNWWFNDPARRRAYIDWLNPAPMSAQEVEQAAAQQRGQTAAAA